MSTHQSTRIDKNQINQDELSKVEQSSIATSCSETIVRSKRAKCCSLTFKVLGLLIIITVVLLFALLPNYIRNRNANLEDQGNTDPTNARLPGGA